MKSKIITTVLAAMAFTMLEPISVSAAQQNGVPDLTEESKSLNVLFFVQINGEDTSISGAQIGINKIADLDVKYGNAEYKVIEDYSTLRKLEDGRDETFTGLSVSETVKLAGEFAELTDKSEKTAVTDKSGKCSFKDLEAGMYLVRELSAEGEAEEYQLIEPYIISVPYPVKNEVTGKYVWNYEVLSEPKTAIVPISSESLPVSDPESEPESSVSVPSTPDSSRVLTGDTQSAPAVIIIMVVSLIFVSILLSREREERKDDKA